MYLSIITMPLLGSIISGFFGRKIGVKGSHIITCSFVILTTALALLAFIEVGIKNTFVSLYLFKWVDTESLNVSWGFNFDSLTVSMLIPVLIVSSLVHVYSIGYMSHDPHQQRFFSYLSLFTFMMIILVTANNYLLMFVGWEGVGICSYLLVSFWFTRIAANQSSISAMLTNRVGDCLLTVGMFAIIWTMGNIDYATVFSLSPFISENIITIIGICLLIGAMAKSSQIGLHIWLPMAMEGPTPVSALIHAATMVTAGVYLLIRSSPLVEYSSTVLLLCLWIGAITSVFSSLIGLFQQDIKKVIAYSTMSQLGLMVVAVGLSSYHVALFHLMNHAFYKALLFLGAGAVIHAVADNQDFRKYGGLKNFLPLSYSVMLIASLSLVAFPYMTGFFSKDFILESSFGGFNLSSITVYYISTIGAMFTTLYSVKTLYLTFVANPNGSLMDNRNTHEGGVYMSSPLVILAIFSIYFGFIAKDMFIGLGSNLFVDNSIFIHPGNEIMLNTEFAVPIVFKLLPLVFTIVLTFTSLIISGYMFVNLIKFKLSRLGYNIFSFFNLRFLVESMYNRYVIEVILKLGGQTTRVLDKGAIEYLGPYGMQYTFTSLSKNLSSLDTGVVTSYALYFLVGAISYLCASYFSIFSDNLFIILFIVAVIITNSLTKNIYVINSNSINKDSKVIEKALKSSMEQFLILIKNYTVEYIKNFKIFKFIIRVVAFRFIFLALSHLILANSDKLPFIKKLSTLDLQNTMSFSVVFIILVLIIGFIITREKLKYCIYITLNLIVMLMASFIIITIWHYCNVDIVWIVGWLTAIINAFIPNPELMFLDIEGNFGNNIKHSLPDNTLARRPDNSRGSLPSSANPFNTLNDSSEELVRPSSPESSNSRPAASSYTSPFPAVTNTHDDLDPFVLDMHDMYKSIYATLKGQACANDGSPMKNPYNSTLWKNTPISIGKSQNVVLARLFTDHDRYIIVKEGFNSKVVISPSHPEYNDVQYRYSKVMTSSRQVLIDFIERARL